MKILAKKRRIEAKTNYLKRRKLLEGRKPRIVVRKSNKYILIQYVESRVAQDKVIVSVNSKDLLEYGWAKEKIGSLKSLAGAYLAGYLFGTKIKKMNTAILDTGLIRNTKGSKVYSAVKGIIDSGFEMSHNPEVFPEEDRIKSDNTKAFFDKVKETIAKGVKK
jgi:large subunit ribosomal protein L18